ncbi:MAG TPA: DinB family protein [Tepidisphaeraceae bacterium]
MNPIQLFVDQLNQNHEMLMGTLGDFSDADVLVRPCPGANNVAWQLGHLIKSEAGALAGFAPGAAPTLPAGFADKITKETAGKDDPNFFPKKAELLDLFGKVRSATIAWAKGLKEADLAQSAPERMRGWAPTAGHWLGAVTGHVAMHVGQFQVIRRKLGKPVLF